MDRWNRTVQAIRRKQIRESDLQYLIQFVEEETTLMNDLLFSIEAVHEYARGPEKQNQRILKQINNCFVKADKKKKVCDSNELKLSLQNFSSVMVTMTRMAADFTVSFQVRVEATF